MSWFADAANVRSWASENFRFPFSKETFVEDLHRERMPTWCLRGEHRELLAFGQFYERFGRANFARVAVNPSLRGRGVGREFIRRRIRTNAGT